MSQRTYLKDYKAPTHLFKTTHLDINVNGANTKVVTTILVESNAENPSTTLELIGRNVKLLSVKMDDKKLKKGESYLLHLDDSEVGQTNGVLQILNTPQTFTLELTQEIDPFSNKSNMGLYEAGGHLTTQCESDGFRRISYYQDRPDVMSIFTTTITADAKTYPTILSNGNLMSRTDNADGTATVTWHDPHLKPCYLFAMVLGELNLLKGSFTTMSGREVALEFYADCDTSELEESLHALKCAMKWDEEKFGREYDLDVFMVFATSSFNMGAMENKGLNIYNTSCLVGSEKTATDAKIRRIRDVVAHEYFHNWSGNRVTCRDWFQLSLKEGFTVARDCWFHEDEVSQISKRIEDVNVMRSMQFVEDAGPTAHPIRPHFFVDVSNFYTLTVYEKGAEIIKMIRSILGESNFRKACDLYFERHDGQAVTTEEFVKAMEDASGICLKQFRNWYDQGGTPKVDVEEFYDPTKQTYILKLKQSVRQIKDYETPKPFHLPIAIGLLDAQGNNMLETNATERFAEGTHLLHFKEAEQMFTFENITEKPVLSFLRNFSAPVTVNFPTQSEADLQHIMQHDSDQFNRWDAGQTLALRALKNMVKQTEAGNTNVLLDGHIIDTFRAILQDENMAPEFAAAMLTLPSKSVLEQEYKIINVDAIHDVFEAAAQQIATDLEPELLATYNRLEEAHTAAARELRNLCLARLVRTGKPAYASLAQTQQENAENMTNEMAAFCALVHHGDEASRKQAIQSFHSKWHHEPDLMDAWLSTQATRDDIAIFDDIIALEKEAVYNNQNANKIRALIGAFCRNYHFHNKTGNGYKLLADEVVRVNAFNPDIAARLLAPLTKWKRYDASRAHLMRTELERLQATAGIASNVKEVISQALDA